MLPDEAGGPDSQELLEVLRMRATVTGRRFRIGDS
jgi:hypothetical protein